MITAILVGAAVALFLGMLGCLELGRRAGARQVPEAAERARAGLGVMEGSIFALFGLLLAFTFSGAASRFDRRRELIVDEATQLSTAYARLDLLSPDDQPAARDLMRRYLDARLEVYARFAAGELDVSEGLARIRDLQGELWARAVTASEARGGPVPILLLPALNSAFDTAAARLAATRFHPPLVIYGLLFALGLVTAFLAGWNLAGVSGVTRFHRVAFALAVSLVIYVSMDLELPRLAFVRVDAADRLLRGVREDMTPGP